MFEQDSYVSLRTFRKSGVAVDTPVWSAHVDDNIYIFSAGEAGKVKRLRNSSQAEMAKCDARGKLLGDWVPAQAVLIDDPSEISKAQTAFQQKYGWQIRMADWGAKLTGRFNKRAYIRVNLT